MQSIPFYRSFLFSMYLNKDIVDIEKPNGISSPSFVWDDLSELFLHTSVLSIIDSRSG